ncbi:hypothetical protein HWV62_24292 [Athelia sp. TMB]|nr:hypothetical protein HWV62_24292 [Athelia sp. TMB]
MPKSKKKAPPEFNNDSVRRCELCGIDIKIGFGGEGNWQQHIDSDKHQRKIPVEKMKSFWQRIPRKSQASASTALPAPLGSSRAPSLLTTVPQAQSQSSQSVVETETTSEMDLELSIGAPGQADTPIDDPAESADILQDAAFLALDQLSIVQPDLGDTDGSTLQQLQTAVRRLPISVGLALPSDELARFSGDPVAAAEGFDDPWEMVDQALNSVIGFGKNEDEISRLVRRGPLGMDGLCNWLARCIAELKVDPILLEGKMQRLINAIQLLVPQNLAESESSVAPDQTATSSTTTGRSNHNHATQPPVPPAKMRSAKDYCPGYTLVFPEGASHYTSYPFALHTVYTLPWSFVISDEGMVLYANDCTHHAYYKTPSSTPAPCTACRALDCHNILMGIRNRLKDGTEENTPWSYLAYVETTKLLERKNKQINSLKLAGLNTARALAVRNRVIDAWKRLAMLISEGKFKRIDALFRVELRNGRSVFGLLEKTKEASALIYHPKSYEERDYQAAYLLWKMGGRAAANLSYRALGTPSISTVRRHVGTTPLLPSSGVPTSEEINTNIAIAFENLAVATDHSGPKQRVIGMSMAIDEIKLQERLRWDPRSNHILGVCREHGKKCTLEFVSMAEADLLLEHLLADTVHMAAEATVVAASLLVDDSKAYGARPFLILGTCKRETVSEQSELLQSASQSLQSHPTLKNCRLYCIGTDGDARRRRALVPLTLVRPLPPVSPIFSRLSPLSLFNLLCGLDDLTSDPDWKHILKRFRNTLLRLQGIKIDGTLITASIIEAHLIQGGMSESAARAVLSPNDKQDVVLMIQLLDTIAQLPEEPTTPANAPNFATMQESRRILRLLGAIYRNLLEAYMHPSLTLHEQLVRLSTAAHLVLAIYTQDKGEFIPAQLFFDLMAMIKNAYFCVAKTQVDDPDGNFWIILLGTDGLEKVFGIVRTIMGNDSHADQFQLTNRIDGAVQCVKILEIHPEWDSGSRRITVKSLEEQAENITRQLDHLNPHSWKGNVLVKDVVLHSGWQAGRIIAEGILRHASIEPPFEKMEAEGGFDIMCPFGGSRVVLIGGDLMPGEREETAEERDEIAISDTPTAPLPLDDLEPDLEDQAGIEEVRLDQSTTGRPAANPWVAISTNSDTRKHKSTICRKLSSPFAYSLSKDRLKTVRGFTQYNEQLAASSSNAQFTAIEEGELSISVEDPALTLVQCDNKIFLAVVRVLELRFNSASLQRLPARILHEPNVRARCQIISLVSCSSSNQPDQADWQWNGLFETGASNSGLRQVEGAWLDVVNPALQTRLQGRGLGRPTYAFHTSELRVAAAVLYERLATALRSLPVVAPSKSFPYQLADGACFLCEPDNMESSERHQPEENCCSYHPTLHISDLSHTKLLEHMGGHILHDPQLKGVDNPCGLCLNAGNRCVIRFVTSNKVDQVDMSRSRCPNLFKIRLKDAAESTATAPCSNYNLRSHIIKNHPSANVDLYTNYFKLAKTESVLMMALFKAKLPKPRKKKVGASKMAISEGTTSRMALRATESTHDAIESIPDEVPPVSHSVEYEESEDGSFDPPTPGISDEECDVNKPAGEPAENEYAITGGTRFPRMVKRSRNTLEHTNECVDCDLPIVGGDDELICNGPGCISRGAS